MVVDEDDTVHAVYEIFIKKGATPNGAATMSVAYEKRPSAGWACKDSMPDIAAGDSSDATGQPCGSGSPRLFLHEVAGVDTLHLAYRRTGCDSFPFWATYRKKPLDAASWGGETYVDTLFGVSSLVVDGDDTVHFFGRRIVDLGASGDSVFILHTYGTPPATVMTKWSVSTDTLGAYFRPGSGKGAPDGDDEEDEQLTALDDGNYIHVAWHGWKADSTKETYFSSLNTTTNTWYPTTGPLMVSLDDGHNSTVSQRQLKLTE
jgi:hypothetical protein